MSFNNASSLHSDAVGFFINEGILTFGDFTLKSGRKSPYFFNTGSLCSGRQLAEMGRLYARMLQQRSELDDATVVFGSAYKGIPIAVATAIALDAGERSSMRAVSDRKEAKTHGDASSFLGVLQPGDRAVVVDDVISTGGTKIEAVEKLRQAGCEPIGLIIAFDRAEPVDETGRTATEAFEAETGLKVFALASIHDIIAANHDMADKLRDHLASFSIGTADKA